ncbi:hypothetical protein IVB22_32425 [Bradyrhizobium sp. 190]|uniref:hypothetical protein n=1 Tax=Bradyrhizobium sp. 190 TaxID=2782658 RepID=UPI001FF9C88C|nr:hypothetical protein [Bradyrhizobium sp. 190]MCK1517129.1 hypothetical protein [Bradyrhizobium sp. 190]
MFIDDAPAPVMRLFTDLISWYHDSMNKATIDRANPQKRTTVTGEPVMVRIQPDMAKALDDWRRKQDDLPGRPEAIRRLVEMALKGKK